MRISLVHLGKRYNKDWIFRNLSFEFYSTKSYAITGPNGSGKSTLLQIVAGSALQNKGSIQYYQADSEIPEQNVFQKISFAAPYLELIEEMTLVEFFSFHQKMKGWLPGLDTAEIINMLGLQKSGEKQIRYYSSGMKQRVKLAQAIFSNVPVVLLDEPLTNLDQEGGVLYQSLVKNYCAGRLLIISSNDENEYSFCDEIINIQAYK